MHGLHGEFHVLPYGQPGEQRIGLEHQAAILARPADRRTPEQDLAAVRFDQSCHGIYQRGLPGPGKAEDCDEFAFPDVQVDAAQNIGNVAGLANEGFGQIAQRKDRLGHDQIVLFLETSACRLIISRSSPKPMKPMTTTANMIRASDWLEPF